MKTSLSAEQQAELDAIQAQLDAVKGAAEQATLGSNGFVITDKKRFPTFVYGYESIYPADLPVYVSADSILTRCTSRSTRS